MRRFSDELELGKSTMLGPAVVSRRCEALMLVEVPPVAELVSFEATEDEVFLLCATAAAAARRLTSVARVEGGCIWRARGPTLEPARTVGVVGAFGTLTGTVDWPRLECRRAPMAV